MDEYLIQWNFWKSDRKRKGKRSTVPAGPERPQSSGPASKVAQPSRRAHARHVFKPDGRGPASVREGEERERRGCQVGPACHLQPHDQRGRRAHRRCYRARQVERVAPLDSGGCRRSGGGGGGRRSSLVHRRRGHAAEVLRASVVPAVPGCKKSGEERRKGQ